MQEEQLKRQLLTPGYRAPGAPERLEQLMQDENTILVDIHYSPHALFQPRWSRERFNQPAANATSTSESRAPSTISQKRGNWTSNWVMQKRMSGSS